MIQEVLVHRVHVVKMASKEQLVIPAYKAHRGLLEVLVRMDSQEAQEILVHQVQLGHLVTWDLLDNLVLLASREYVEILASLVLRARQVTQVRGEHKALMEHRDTLVQQEHLDWLETLDHLASRVSKEPEALEVLLGILVQLVMLDHLDSKVSRVQQERKDKEVTQVQLV